MQRPLAARRGLGWALALISLLVLANSSVPFATAQTGYAAILGPAELDPDFGAAVAPVPH